MFVVSRFSLATITTSQIPSLRAGILPWCGVTHAQAHDTFPFAMCRYLSIFANYKLNGWGLVGEGMGVTPSRPMEQLKTGEFRETEDNQRERQQF